MYGLLGRKLGHSYSPQIHALLSDVPYELREVEPEDLEQFLKTTELTALNVTIPYKKDVLPFCSARSETVSRIGCANTLVKASDGWHAYNTDYAGFEYLVKRSGVEIQGQKCIVLGSGGASLTARTVLKDLGAGQVVVISRTGEDNYRNLWDRHRDADIIVNCTPVGMYPENGESPVDLFKFSEPKAVFDVVYNPARTRLLLDAERLGIPAFNGLPMLVAQARRSSELFSGTSIPDTKVEEVTAALTRQMRNIVVIGMPGSGKSSLAEILGKRLGRPVYDTDAEVVKRWERAIPDIFAEDGEDAFRRMETEVIRDLGRLSGAVISTGGGAVTRSENYGPLHQNAIILWVRRALEDLPTAGRPLSQAHSATSLWEKRKYSYAYFSDASLDNDSTLRVLADNAERILNTK